MEGGMREMGVGFGRERGGGLGRWGAQKGVRVCDSESVCVCVCVCVRVCVSVCL